MPLGKSGKTIVDISTPLKRSAGKSRPAGGCTGSCVRWPTGFRNVPAVLKDKNNKNVRRGNRGVALYAGKENSVQRSRVKTRYRTIGGMTMAGLNRGEWHSGPGLQFR